MVAFAANSLLCRLALGDTQIDAATFSLVRVLAGTATLALLVLPQLLRRPPAPPAPPAPPVPPAPPTSNSAAAQIARLVRPYFSPRSALALSAYLLCFSFAYISLTAATGALILFGAVQFTMFSAALVSGERFSLLAWLGLAMAAAGVVYLLLPGVDAPETSGTALMIVAGVAWGLYSLIGRGTDKPLLATTINFFLATPLVAGIAAAYWWFADSTSPGLTAPYYTATGLSLAMASGAIASGVGYAIWYNALRGLSAGSAAIVQLCVPVIAAVAAVALLSEPLSVRLIIATIAVLGGMALALRN